MRTNTTGNFVKQFDSAGLVLVLITFVILSLTRMLDFIYTHMHAYTHRHPLFPLLVSHTHRHERGLQMCDLICFQQRLFSCQCADSEFSALSYEIRAGDVRTIQ